MRKRKIIIDCDPGIDDAYAIAVALKEPQFEVLGIHTVSGNVSLEHTTRNAQGLLYTLNSKAPIHKGASRPLVLDPIYAGDVHGQNGLAGYQFEETKLNPVSTKTSLQAYYEAFSTSEDPITIIAIGPLTNVALFIKSYPELVHRIECISLMGGGLKGGNITIAGEFNFYVDPHAAKIVFESQVPIIMAGLDVTEKARFYEEDVEFLRKHAGRIGEILHYITQPGLDVGVRYGIGRCTAPNDVVSVLVLTDEHLFTAETHEVHILVDGEGRGMSIANTRLRDKPKFNTVVLKDVDVTQFRETIKRKLSEN